MSEILTSEKPAQPDVLRRRVGRKLRVALGVTAAAALLAGAAGCGPVTAKSISRDTSGRSVEHAAGKVAGLVARAPFNIGHASCLGFFLFIGAFPKWSDDKRWADSICGSQVTLSFPDGSSSDPTVTTSPLGHALTEKAISEGYNYADVTHSWFDTNDPYTTPQCTLSLISGPEEDGKPTYVVVQDGDGSGFYSKPTMILSPDIPASQARQELGC